MRLRAMITASLLCLLLLVGCKANLFKELDSVLSIIDQPGEPVFGILNAGLEEAEPTALMARDPDAGDVYLLVTTGEANKIQRALKITGNEYDSNSKTFTLYLTDFKPQMGVGMSHSSSDWMTVVRFRKHNFETLRVVVDMDEDEDGSQQRVYELSWD